MNIIIIEKNNALSKSLLRYANLQIETYSSFEDINNSDFKNKILVLNIGNDLNERILAQINKSVDMCLVIGADIMMINYPNYIWLPANTDTDTIVERLINISTSMKISKNLEPLPNLTFEYSKYESLKKDMILDAKKRLDQISKINNAN